MYSPKLNDKGSFGVLRAILLVWGILRLIVSALWTGAITIRTVYDIKTITTEPLDAPHHEYRRAQTWFNVFAVLMQLVEFGMIVTFITAGVKKSASLYRAYYRYCILALILYIIVVMLSIFVDFDSSGNGYFVEVYLTYHIDELPFADSNLTFVFLVVATFVVGLEILLICLINKMINSIPTRLRQNV